MPTNVQRNSIRPDGSLDWEDVEKKVSLIRHRFSGSIDHRYMDDLAQTVRLFAWQKSSNYQDMIRRTIDFYRQQKRTVFRESLITEYNDIIGDDEERSLNQYSLISVPEYFEGESFKRISLAVEKELAVFINCAVNDEEFRTATNALILFRIYWSVSHGGSEYCNAKLYRGMITNKWLSEVIGISQKEIHLAKNLIKDTIKTCVLLKKIDCDDIPESYLMMFLAEDDNE